MGQFDALRSKLTGIQKRIKDAELKKAQLEGQRGQLLKSLKEKHGLDTIEAAKQKVETLKAEQVDCEKEIKETEAVLDGAMKG